MRKPINIKVIDNAVQYYQQGGFVKNKKKKKQFQR